MFTICVIGIVIALSLGFMQSLERAEHMAVKYYVFAGVYALAIMAFVWLMNEVI